MALGGDQDNFAVIPVTTGLNRYGRIWRSLSILVQARPEAMRTRSNRCAEFMASAGGARKEDDFVLQRPLIEYSSGLLHRAAGVTVISLIARWPRASAS